VVQLFYQWLTLLQWLAWLKGAEAWLRLTICTLAQSPHGLLIPHHWLEPSDLHMLAQFPCLCRIALDAEVDARDLEAMLFQQSTYRTLYAGLAQGKPITNCAKIKAQVSVSRHQG
jgi:hypothetical protein